MSATSSSSNSPNARVLPRRPLLPLQRPPKSLIPSTLPVHLSHPPASSSLPGFLATRHLIPAAYPRLARSAVSPPAPRPARDIWPRVGLGEGKAEKKRRLEVENEAMVEMVLEGEFGQGRLKDGERFGEGLGILVDRFVREDWKDTDGKQAVTLICGNANGMPVEHWLLPLTILLSLRSPSQPYFIAEVWFFNTLLTPALSPQSIGTHYSWSDHSRDILSFIQHTLPLSASPEPLPTELGWELRRGGRRRKGLVGLGHSFSATSWLLAEMEMAMVESQGEAAEGVWEGLILVDPMIIDPKSLRYKFGMIRADNPNPFARGALSRQDTWPTFSAASRYLSSSALFADYAPEQMRALLEYGVAGVPSDQRKPGEDDHTVTLAVPRWAEALTFSGSHAFAEVWDRVEFGENVGRGCRQVRFIWAGKGISSGSQEDHARLTEFLKRTAPQTVGTVLEGVGHMAVQEAPEKVGMVMRDVLVDIFGMSPGEKARL